MLKNDPNIARRNMLRAFGHRVDTCWVLTIFKLEPTAPNRSLQISTRWPNAHNMLRLTMLRYVALDTCCDRLARA